ncbi:hypothetical protein C8F04DRAFT_1251338 [Mycena alexandri]|uniref:Transmembrane protein n=1 Tax=Mycena alexandri TaxID=1745969 RepID=A0AAD6TD39_9AGAR|nr:hypothetical protein C8F04DRAFT_1251338 [Mycena alexandri]
MSTESSSSSLPLAPTPSTSTSTNIVDEALLFASSEDTDSDSQPIVPWRTGATPLPRRTVAYLGHTNWRANHAPEGERRHVRIRRRVVRIRRRPRKVYEDGISRDFFLIMALCFVLACLLVVSLRPIALEILWYIDD